MSGPKRNPDKLNTIGVVVVGICGAVLVYVTIVALQAFYMDDTAEVQTMADYGGQDTTAKGHKADEVRNITEPAINHVANGPATYRIPIDVAIQKVIEDAKTNPSHLIPSQPASDKATTPPVFQHVAPAAAPPAPAAGSGSAAGSAAPAAGSASGVPPGPALVPTGTGTGNSPGAGSSSDKPTAAKGSGAAPAAGSGNAH